MSDAEWIDDLLEKHSNFWYIVGLYDESKTSPTRLSSEQAKAAIEQKLNSAHTDELSNIPHKLLHIPEVWQYYKNRMAELQASKEGK